MNAIKYLTFLAFAGVLAVQVHAGAYHGMDLYTLGAPIPNGGGGSLYFLTDSGYVAAGGQVIAMSNDSATLWLSPAGTARDLTPTGLGFQNGIVETTNGTYQVGNSGSHAILWHGTAASAVDLGLGNAIGVSPSGAQQVGENGRAVLWNGSAASIVDLRPPGFPADKLSVAVATNGSRQVGSAFDAAFRDHAMMWSGTAASAVDLDPALPGIAGSAALGISRDGTQQVGLGITFVGANQYSHALRWTNSAASAVDLNPADFLYSVALDADADEQVGWGYGAPTSGNQHAMLWNDTPASAVDLNGLLPFAATTSFANSIDAQGDIFGTATDTAGHVHAVEWMQTFVPEPASPLLLLGAACLLLLTMRCHEQRRRIPALGGLRPRA